MRVCAYVDGPEHAPALVLSSSLGTTHAMWEPQVAGLARGHRVIRYDRRGHGATPVAGDETTIAALGADVLELLDRDGIERASFCGLSLGGAVGMWLAINAPERIDRLVLACTKPRFSPATQWTDRAAVVRENGVAALADAILERWFTPSFFLAHPEGITRFREMLASTPAEGYAACCDVLAGFDVRAGLDRITAPTLVITGEADPVAPPETGDELAAAIPGARHVSIAGAAHIANVERPEAFTAAVLEFIAEGDA